MVVFAQREDDSRRYTVDNDFLIRTPGRREHLGCGGSAKNSLQPATRACSSLRSTDSQNYAKECAAHGYVGVVAYARGRHKSTARFIPFQHDGEDARAVINWIAKQPWSDGRVGMYGQGYGGFTPWAAAKGLPHALKAIASPHIDCAWNQFSDGRQHTEEHGIPAGCWMSAAPQSPVEIPSDNDSA